MSDIEVFDAALTDRRAVLTLNRKHFVQLHRQRPGIVGAMVCTVDSDFVALRDESMPRSTLIPILQAS